MANMCSIRQLHIVASSNASSGGEGLAALRYVESIARAGGQVVFMSRDIPDNYSIEFFTKEKFSMQAVPIHQNLLIELFTQYSFFQGYFERVKIDLVHIHGMWSPILAIAASVARSKNIPVMISPHGSLEPWALRYKHIKKWLALKIYQRAILRSASLFVATATKEMESIRKLHLYQPIAVIPNGVDVVPQHRCNDSQKEIKRLLFLSRIHPIKGLHDLVEAWALVRQTGWRIVIAGGDEGGYRKKVEDLIRDKGLEADFEFLGYVEGKQKQACFNDADIFILPTYSENFGIAVAEALVNELPVITTTGAPWQDLVTYRCGWWVPPGVQGISSALTEMLKCDSHQLKEMGQRGRQVAVNKFSWDMIGVTALRVSEWVLNQSMPRPEVIKLCQE
jgi:glycosyltransferase involved in cell wall biosynthesis